MELTGGRRVAFVVALVLAIVPWVYQFTFVNTALGTAQQITQFVAAWLGVIAFCAVGPIAMLSRSGTFWMAAIGPILFEVLEQKSSALALFVQTPLVCGVVAIAWNAIVFVVMFYTEKRGMRANVTAAAALALVPFVAILVRFL